MDASFHRAVNEIRNISGRIQNILDEHRRVFKQQPLVALRHVLNLKDNLVRAKFQHFQGELVKGWLLSM